MRNMVKTPFAEYREEQVKLNIFDYFVEPSFFEKFCDTKPILISGARGTGKTTILKALTMAEAKDVGQYLSDNSYIGIYYRVDLNITSSFQGEGLSTNQWEKLFAYYFVSKLSYALIGQFLDLKSEIGFKGEEDICKKYAKLFSGKKDACTLTELKMLIFDELYAIRDYINNCAYNDYPHIGDYEGIIRELPRDLLNGASTYNMKEKTVFYLVDEFEGLSDWQQKIVLSFVKYADKYHTYKICMRPDGLKTSQTVGAEYIRETDDIRTVELNDLIFEKKDEYYKYALDVCNKRMELFYKQNNLDTSSLISFEELFEELKEEEEFQNIFQKKEMEIKSDIEQFIREVDIRDGKIVEFLDNNYFDFLIFRLLYSKNKRKESVSDIFMHVREKDKKYVDAVGNYKYALLYHLCLKYSIQKSYSGFATLVNISGGTLRYLLELCNEIFERAIGNGRFNYEEPCTISHKLQTEAVVFISNKRVNQISAIPQIGPNMRTFVISLGRIYRILHRDERISNFEPNHFSIKASRQNTDEKLELFLKECVIRGVLLKKKNNKNKVNYVISLDEYIYMLPPIYTPSFQISWRRKQKTEFQIDELNVLINNDSAEINKIIKKYEKKYLRSNADNFSEWECVQMRITLGEDE